MPVIPFANPARTVTCLFSRPFQGASSGEGKGVYVLPVFCCDDDSPVFRDGWLRLPVSDEHAVAIRVIMIANAADIIFINISNFLLSTISLHLSFYEEYISSIVPVY